MTKSFLLILALWFVSGFYSTPSSAVEWNNNGSTELAETETNDQRIDMSEYMKAMQSDTQLATANLQNYDKNMGTLILWIVMGTGLVAGTGFFLAYRSKRQNHKKQ